MVSLDIDRCLTVRHPWAHYIISGHKTIENRTWQTAHRGPLAIHAALILDLKSFRFIESLGLTPPEIFDTGAIIGVVDVVDCVRGSADPWAFRGCWNWVLENPRPVTPIPMKGQLGLFSTPRTIRPRSGQPTARDRSGPVSKQRPRQPRRMGARLWRFGRAGHADDVAFWVAELAHDQISSGGSLGAQFPCPAQALRLL